MGHTVLETDSLATRKNGVKLGPRHDLAINRTHALQRTGLPFSAPIVTNHNLLQLQLQEIRCTHTGTKTYNHTSVLTDTLTHTNTQTNIHILTHMY